MVGTTSHESYTSGERGVDDQTYNPQADARPDNADFNPDVDNGDFHPIAARGADNHPTGREFAQEDEETAFSDQTGSIPKGEVDDLLNSATSEERGVSGRTRGVKNDAWKQDRELDNAFADSGLEDDVEIGRATGA